METQQIENTKATDSTWPAGIYFIRFEDITAVKKCDIFFAPFVPWRLKIITAKEQRTQS